MFKNQSLDQLFEYYISLSEVMSVFQTNRERGENQTVFVNESQSSEEQFISICQRFNDKTIRQAEAHKKMDMIYNYMIKNDVKIQKKSDVKEEKVRKTRKDKEGRKYICGCEGRPGYLSYPALYTHIKTKHDGVAPPGTIRGESGKPKKRGRPKVRKAPQIYERQIEKNEFPKELSGLVQSQHLQILSQFDEIEPSEDDEPSEITLKYFVSIVRDLKKVLNTRIYLLPINQVITVFLDNIKEYVGQSYLQDFQETFYDLITYVNRKYAGILAEYQLISKYYIDYDLKEGEVYCQIERPTYLPVIIQRFIKNELSAEDQLQQTLLLDFCKWLYTQKLTEIQIKKEGTSNPMVKE